MRLSAEDRFWAKVDKNGSCWLWTAFIHHSGYGRFWDGKRHRNAHDFSYEMSIGPVPDGLVIDHLCGTKSCVRPEHLEAVTSGENTRRYTVLITHCPLGHPYDGANLYIDPRGQRHCRKCACDAVRRYRSKGRESS